MGEIQNKLRSFKEMENAKIACGRAGRNRNGANNGEAAAYEEERRRFKIRL